MSKATFDFANANRPPKFSQKVYDAYVDAFRKDLSIAGIATAMHRADPSVKNVALVSDKSGSLTALVKYHSGPTLTLHAYIAPTDSPDLSQVWESDVTIQAGEVTLH